MAFTNLFGNNLGSDQFANGIVNRPRAQSGFKVSSNQPTRRNLKPLAIPSPVAGFDRVGSMGNRLQGGFPQIRRKSQQAGSFLQAAQIAQPVPQTSSMQFAPQMGFNPMAYALLLRNIFGNRNLGGV